MPEEEILQMEKTSVGKSLERACSSQHLKNFCVKISLVVEGDRDKKRMVVNRESEFQVIEGC